MIERINPIRAARQAAGMTQQKLADQSGINIRTIQKVEKGEAEIGNLTAKNLLAIADALGVQPRALVPAQPVNIFSENEPKSILQLMIDKYSDSVYGAAMMKDREAAQAVIDQAESFYKENPTDPWKGAPCVFPDMPEPFPYEEQLADELHGKLFKVALDAWCRSYTREQMVRLVNLLHLGEGGVMESRLTICDGGDALIAPQIRDAWNAVHPDESPILTTDPDSTWVVG